MNLIKKHKEMYDRMFVGEVDEKGNYSALSDAFVTTFGLHSKTSVLKRHHLNLKKKFH